MTAAGTRRRAVSTPTTGDAPLDEYRTKRQRHGTPEPMPGDARRASTRRSAAPTFVIQEHHASSLHWDFRLEHDGVLVSWALPKGLPRDPATDHLAVPTEDHPLDYAGFAGTIPDGAYGAGVVTIWDAGTYSCEKWTATEVKVVLHGRRTEGTYVLFPAGRRNWLIHRMTPRADDDAPAPDDLRPMLATPGPLAAGGRDEWAYEYKWDGVRAVVRVAEGRVAVTSRNGHDLTPSVPELRPLGERFGSREAVLDGELVVLGPGGVPSFHRMQRRARGSPSARSLAEDPVAFVVFDLMHLDGRSLLDQPYDTRRARLVEAMPEGAAWDVTPSFTGPVGPAVLQAALDSGMEGVVAKRRSSRYLPGRRNPDWVKTKPEHTQEVVIGGWTAGEGSRRSTFGALVLGITDGRTGTRPLTYVGKVGTGFDERARRELLAAMVPLARRTPPFEPAPSTAVTRTATWVRPTIVGEVAFREWTGDGHLRHPVWRGLRADRSPDEVRREP